jgi:glycosyltransferase involved in cell wall biosynthesis
MDADLQHPPELIRRMVQLREEGHDQVVARRTRTGDGLARTLTARLYYRLVNRLVELHAQGYDQVMARRDRGGDRLTRTLTARLYYRIVNRLVDVELVDGVGDFRLLSRRVVDAVLGLTEYNRFSKGLFAWVGFPSTTFEYENAVREHGTSSWSFRSLLNYGLDGLLSFNNRPLRAALHLGLGLVLCAGLYTAWIVGAALVHGVQTPGYVTTITAVTALAGVQMIMLGVIGEYTGRIYYEVKGRPHFLVKATNVERTKDLIP